MFEELGLPCSVLVNSAMYGYAPRLVAAFRARGDEIVGHGRTNSERQGVLPETDERALIEEATAIIARHEGRSAAGLARAVDLAEPGDAGPAGGGRLSLSARLVPRRPADLVSNPPGRAHPVRALSAGAERHSPDRGPEAGGRRLRGHDRRHLRRDARGGRRPAAGDGHRAARLSGGMAPPGAASAPRAQAHPRHRRRGLWFTTAGAIAAHVAALPKGTVPGDQVS